MLRGKKHLLLLIAAANVVLVAGILYSAVDTNTYNMNINDQHAFVSGGANHGFTIPSGVTYHGSYSTTVYHNGSYVDSDWNPVSGTGPDMYDRTTWAFGGATSIYSAHNSSGGHASYIENDSNPSDNDYSSKGSYTSVSSD